MVEISELALDSNIAIAILNEDKRVIEEIQVEGNMAFAVTSSKGTTLIHATGDTIPDVKQRALCF